MSEPKICIVSMISLPCILFLALAIPSLSAKAETTFKKLLERFLVRKIDKSKTVFMANLQYVNLQYVMVKKEPNFVKKD